MHILVHCHVLYRDYVQYFESKERLCNFCVLLRRGSNDAVLLSVAPRALSLRHGAATLYFGGY